MPGPEREGEQREIDPALQARIDELLTDHPDHKLYVADVHPDTDETAVVLETTDPTVLSYDESFVVYHGGNQLEVLEAERYRDGGTTNITARETEDELDITHQIHLPSVNAMVFYDDRPSWIIGTSEDQEED